MPTAEIILHIGRPKTGSTAIQRALEYNRERLRSRGVLYPGASVDHNNEIRDLPEGPLCQGLRREILESDAQRAIISAEGLSTLNPVIVREWLSGFTVWPIVYLRDQAEALVSGYQQIVKAELESRTLAEYLEDIQIIDYLPFLRRWMAAFGRGRLIVLPYCVDVANDFLTRMGLGDLPLPLQADPNPSIAGDLLEAKRILNRGWPSSALELREFIYWDLLAIANKFPQYRGMQVDPALLSQTRAKHAECNRELERRFGVRLEPTVGKFS